MVSGCYRELKELFHYIFEIYQPVGFFSEETKTKVFPVRKVGIIQREELHFPPSSTVIALLTVYDSTVTTAHHSDLSLYSRSICAVKGAVKQMTTTVE